jgi:hypothetical protein
MTCGYSVYTPVAGESRLMGGLAASGAVGEAGALAVPPATSCLFLLTRTHAPTHSLSHTGGHETNRTGRATFGHGRFALTGAGGGCRARRDVFSVIDAALEAERGATRELFDELDPEGHDTLAAADVDRLLQRLAPGADRAASQYIRRQVEASGAKQVCKPPNMQRSSP